MSVRRDTGVKNPVPLSNIADSVAKLLNTIHDDMFTRAKKTYDSHVIAVTNWSDFVPALDNKCIVAIPWCGDENCEDDIKERSGRAYVSDNALFLLFFFMEPSSLDLNLRMNEHRRRARNHSVFHLTIHVGLQ